MSNPSQGSGNGGDRCTEACAAMIAKTYNVPTIPFKSSKEASGEDIMYWFTEMLNKGSNVSALEDAAWINRWFSQKTNGQITLGNIHAPSYQDIQNAINRSHCAIGGFNNYANLRLYSGGNPYKWTDPQALGHVLMVVGYDTDHQSVWVHDPLRADPSGQPAEYSWVSFVSAQFSDLSEVLGPGLGAGSSGIGVDLGAAGRFMAPDATVVAMCVALDKVAELKNPFDVTAQQDTINAGPVNLSFSDPISWLGAVSNAFWNDFGALSFRFLIVLVGVVMLLSLVKSWIPAAGQSAGAVSAATALV